VTLADRLEAVLLELGAMAECHLATAVQKRKEDVRAELERYPLRFVHNGKKARASRWDVRRRDEAGWPEGFEQAEEALVSLIRSKLQTPEEALERIATAWAAA
jgi:hypothetical protein